MIDLYRNGRITGSNSKGTVEFYSALMDAGQRESYKKEKGECFFSHIFKKIDNLNRGVPEDHLNEDDFIKPTYIIVEDLERETIKAKKLGAKVIQEKTEVNGGGLFSLISDPTGGVVSLWQKIDR